MSKMTPEVKAKWLEALRSGEYEQGRQFLRTRDNEFCCLGVLCDLAVKAGVIEEPTADGWGEYRYGDGGEQSGLPDEVSDWAGIDTQLGRFSHGGVDTALAFLNDRGTPFSEIADIIESEF